MSRAASGDLGDEGDAPTLPARRARAGQALGPCGLCGRPMVGGPSVDRHHLVPKTFGGREAVWMHRVCHRKVHSVLTERELARCYSTFEALRSHEAIARFVKWIQKKDPEFTTRHRTHSAKKRR